MRNTIFSRCPSKLSLLLNIDLSVILILCEWFIFWYFHLLSEKPWMWTVTVKSQRMNLSTKACRASSSTTSCSTPGSEKINWATFCEKWPTSPCKYIVLSIRGSLFSYIFFNFSTVQWNSGCNLSKINIMEKMFSRSVFKQI